MRSISLWVAKGIYPFGGILKGYALKRVISSVIKKLIEMNKSLHNGRLLTFCLCGDQTWAMRL